MEIVDSQVHLWNGITGHSDSALPSFTYKDLLPQMDAAGVQRAILVPPSWATDGNQASYDAAAALPNRFAVMGRIEVEKPESRGSLAAFKARPGVLGARLAFRREPHATYLANGTADWFWPEAAACKLQVMIYAPGKLDLIAEVARKHPQLRVIVDHMGLVPTARGAEKEAQLEGLARIAPLENVSVKLSAVPLYSDVPYPHPDTHELMKRVIKLFGAERTFWGSDFTRLECSYPEAVAAFAEADLGLTGREKELILGRAILNWLDWK